MRRARVSTLAQKNGGAVLKLGNQALVRLQSILADLIDLLCSRLHHFCIVRLLLPDGAAPVFPATLKEAMTHHALAKQKKYDCQDDCKEELANSERGWLSSCRVRRFQISCHQSCAHDKPKLLHFYRVLVRKPSLYNSEHTRMSECVVASIVLLVWLTALWVLPGLRKQTEIQNQASQKLPCYIYRNAF